MTDELKFATIRVMKQSDMLRCPFVIIHPAHYREDGSCKCDNEEHRAMMIREWGYTKKSFKGIPLRKKES